MAETQRHTPGPWIYEIHGDEIFIGPYDAVYKGVAAIVSTLESHPAREPNARLLAAAPDLLKAAKEVYEWMNQLPVPTTGCTTKMQVLYNAIDKAESGDE